jgi:hypothetical protein
MNEFISLWSHYGSLLFVASAITLTNFHHNDKTHMKAYGSKALVKEGKIYFKATKCNPFNRMQAKVVPCPCANVRF